MIYYTKRITPITFTRFTPLHSHEERYGYGYHGGDEYVLWHRAVNHGTVSGGTLCRNQTLSWFGTGHPALKWLAPATKMVDGVVLTLFATILFSTMIPMSTNGDYIVAGC